MSSLLLALTLLNSLLCLFIYSYKLLFHRHIQVGKYHTGAIRSINKYRSLSWDFQSCGLAYKGVFCMHFLTYQATQIWFHFVGFRCNAKFVCSLIISLCIYILVKPDLVINLLILYMFLKATSNLFFSPRNLIVPSRILDFFKQGFLSPMILWSSWVTPLLEIPDV